MEPVVSSLQPTAGSTQTGPAECAERLNPPPLAESKGQGVLNPKIKTRLLHLNLHFQSHLPTSFSNNFLYIDL